MDPVTLEIVYHHTKQIIAEMSVKMVRSGYSTIIKESHDFTFSILDKDCSYVAQHDADPIQLGVVGPQCKEVVRVYKDRINEGDTFILNHPYQGCQNHTADVTVITPAFFHHELIGFVGNTAHKPDIGGKVPGTCAGDATDVFQEGLLLPAVKLFDRGNLSEDLTRLIKANTRTPEVTWGDIMGQAKTNSYGVERIALLMEKYGKDEILECWETWIKICEQELRKRIQRIPDGTYGPAIDYIDDDGISLDTPLHIRVTLEKKGDELHFSLDSATQGKGPVNLRPCVGRAIIEYCIKAALAPDLPNNQGIAGPIRITFPPEGSLLNPGYPAAVNMYATTAHRLTGVVMMVLAQAIPDKVTAPQSGSGAPVSFAGRNLRTGRWYSEYEILWGGYGARPTKDGISGMSQDSSNVMNSPVESIESEFPMMIECYEIIPDSGGAGKFRGGLGVRRNWKVLGDSVILNLRTDRFKFSSPGIFGALPARPSRCHLNPGTSQEIRLTSKQTNVQLKRGDVVSLELAGGGGWGKPEERDPNLVLKDVIEGDVSLEQAREVYKVWIDPDTFSINEKATESLRYPYDDKGG